MEQDESSPSFVDENEEIYKQLKTLDEQKQGDYRKAVELYSQYGEVEVPKEFRQDVIRILQKDLPAKEQSREINDYAAKYDANPNWGKERNDQAQIEKEKQALRSYDTAYPKAPTRPDVSKYEHAPEQASKATAHSQPAAEPHLVPADNLQKMLKEYETIRETNTLRPVQLENNHRATLADRQAAERQELQERHEAQPHPRQPELRRLLNHQHLAERVSLEAHLLGQGLRDNDPELAQRLSHEAHYTAQAGRDIRDERQTREATMRGSSGAERGGQDRSERQGAGQQQKPGPSRGGGGRSR